MSRAAETPARGCGENWEMSPIIRRIRPDEGLRLRALRLRALADSPSAFGSTLAREEAFAEAVWRQRATGGALGENRVTCVAEEGGRWIGMATGILRDADDFQAELVGMFVEPAGRGRRVGVTLVEAVSGWARSRGLACLHLHVTSTNQAALAL